jgi:predicted RNA-binding Zn-ribbon protein involved in translation (DUF1610 family)
LTRSTEGKPPPLRGAHAEPLGSAEAEAWRDARRRVQSLWVRWRSGVPLSADDLRLPELDHDRLFNALHVPDDAGPYAAALEGILRRIPDGWGRWVDCDRGWYPLIVELDRKLTALDPGYIVYQIKQKFGVLRVYIESAQEVARDMRTLIADASTASRSSCEACGQPGQLMEGSGRVKTLCPRCGMEAAFLPREQAFPISEVAGDTSGLGATSQ